MDPPLWTSSDLDPTISRGLYTNGKPPSPKFGLLFPSVLGFLDRDGCDSC